MKSRLLVVLSSMLYYFISCVYSSDQSLPSGGSDKSSRGVPLMISPSAKSREVMTYIGRLETQMLELGDIVLTLQEQVVKLSGRDTRREAGIVDLLTDLTYATGLTAEQQLKIVKLKRKLAKTKQSLREVQQTHRRLSLAPGADSTAPAVPHPPTLRVAQVVVISPPVGVRQVASAVQKPCDTRRPVLRKVKTDPQLVIRKMRIDKDLYIQMRRAAQSLGVISRTNFKIVEVSSTIFSCEICKDERKRLSWLPAHIKIVPDMPEIRGCNFKEIIITRNKHPCIEVVIYNKKGKKYRISTRTSLEEFERFIKALCQETFFSLSRPERQFLTFVLMELMQIYKAGPWYREGAE